MTGVTLNDCCQCEAEVDLHVVNQRFDFRNGSGATGTECRLSEWSRHQARNTRRHELLGTDHVTPEAVEALSTPDIIRLPYEQVRVASIDGSLWDGANCGVAYGPWTRPPTNAEDWLSSIVH